MWLVQTEQQTGCSEIWKDNLVIAKFPALFSTGPEKYMHRVKQSPGEGPGAVSQGLAGNRWHVQIRQFGESLIKELFTKVREDHRDHAVPWG